MSLRSTNSPFTDEQAQLLNQLLPSLDPDQVTWLSGYLAGAASSVQAPAGLAPGFREAVGPAPAAAPAIATLPVTVLYASQTGNCAWLAREMARRLQSRGGFEVTLATMAATKPRKLKDISRLLVVVSTQGDGVPPDNGLLFYEDLRSGKAPPLKGLRYSVLALGDVSYDDFCIIGRNVDQRLAELGAECLYPRVECDLDFQEPSDAWMSGVLEVLAAEAPPGASGNARTAPTAPNAFSATGAARISPLPTSPATAPAVAYSRFRPFDSEILENVNLNGHGSGKETRHVELSLEGSGLVFEPGDSIGVYPQNDPRLVDLLLGEMGWKAEEPVPVSKTDERPLRDALLRDYEITVLTRPLLQSVAELSRDGLKELVARDRDAELQGYVHGRDLVDLARDFRLKGLPARQFVRALRRMPPRLYSIASSRELNPGEVHLVIVAVRYEQRGRRRSGVFSVQCAERLQPGDQVPVYVNSNPAFRMPPDPGTPIIMIGPGTGVAPFRSFLQEREARGMSGKTWLFYGDRRFKTDFLYQVDWQQWLKSGALTRMDVAFSRDGRDHCYVQHRMQEQGRDLFQWLEEGAAVYVCGDEKGMAPDVNRALECIVGDQGGMGAEKAKEYVTRLRETNRYQRDVY